jgi:hypothetical protein
VIGRASPDGDAPRTTTCSRSGAWTSPAADRVGALRGHPGDRARQAAHPDPLVHAADDQPDQPGALQEELPVQPRRHRPTISPIIAWDEDQPAHLQTGLDGASTSTTSSSREWQNLYGAINRVVLIIPIPCLGDEYEKRKTILDRPEGTSLGAAVIAASTPNWSC